MPPFRAWEVSTVGYIYKIQLKMKPYGLVVSIIVNLILGYWIYDLTHSESKNEELIKSQSRVEVLELNLKASESNLSISINKIDSLDSLITIKPLQRTEIARKYETRRNNVIALDNDSALRLLASRLSQVKIN